MSNSNNIQSRPTPGKPMLIGLMVDVSGSMTSSIQNMSGQTQTRLESFSNSFDDLIEYGTKLSEEKESKEILPLFKLFAYGFGFGNPLSFIFGGGSEDVRDLLVLPDFSGSTITINKLAKNWDLYKNHIEGMVTQMFGATPMYKAFKEVKERFEKERKMSPLTGPPVLFVLSDGEPTDGTSEQILEVADDLKKQGILIISCYVTAHNITHHKKLYSKTENDWPEGAQLMFQCSSILNTQSPFFSYMKEYNWDVEENAHLFAQINQSEILGEFLKAVLSPLDKKTQVQKSDKIRVFVSYSHHDQKYIKKGKSLLGYLRGLEKEGFEFWTDERIVSGDLWDEKIEDQIVSSDIALVLVSQFFLNSRYCMEVEITKFIEGRKKRGLRIFPIILSACDWKNHEWLRSTQFRPKHGKNLESHFNKKGKQTELYLDILEDLRKIGEEIVKERSVEQTKGH
jgi:hypothetical protein